MLKTSFKKYKKELEMNEDENKVSENTDLDLNDEIYPYKNDVTFNENMEKAKSVEIARNTYVYTNAEDSFKENMSTAWSFLGIGVVGTVFTILNLTGVLHIMQGFMQKGISLLLFLGFMVYGIIVIRSKKDMLAKIENDEKKLDDVIEELYKKTMESIEVINCEPMEVE